ncbi:uroporphyrinogen-III synthase [Uliginosibacterium sp. H1]|uniref:uroporphyrinogen-III synthase n=1 Tax=Uliginosibacterium sp. H1 TaxID=3114757 RepID=UPI002E174CEA|nr:uroporphyrinogen-III synthase [Uliginosibacterium sp. H1]
MTGPLSGRCLAVARPREQTEALAAALTAAGADVWRLHLLHIEALADTTPLHQVGQRLSDYQIAFFVSPNAVRHAMAVLQRYEWPQALQVATIGPGSADALRESGFDTVLVPEGQFDSEAVLDLPAFSEHAVRGRRVLILRGDGGRELLADTLRKRGATVDAVQCYRRVPASPDLAPLGARLKAGALDGIIVTSSEALRRLDELPGGKALLEGCTLFVSHARIAAGAERLGAGRIVLTAPGDDGIVAGVIDHFVQNRSQA